MEMIYAAWARHDHHWVRDMLENWKRSGRKYLCFPWMNPLSQTLPAGGFWIYIYYMASRTDIPELQGIIEYRLRVESWRPLIQFEDQDVYLARTAEEALVWFRCDCFEKIGRLDGSQLTLDDFQHTLGAKLVQTLRDRLPPVICTVPVFVLEQYPATLPLVE